MLILKLSRAQIALRRVQSAGVVHVDEFREVVADILERLVSHQIDGFDLERLDQALGLGIVIGVAAPAHRAEQAVLSKQFPIALGRVLAASVRVVNTPLAGLTRRDGRLQSRRGEPRVNRATDCPTRDAARLGVDHHRHVDEAVGYRDVGDVGGPGAAATSTAPGRSACATGPRPRPPAKWSTRRLRRASTHMTFCRDGRTLKEVPADSSSPAVCPVTKFMASRVFSSATAGSAKRFLAAMLEAIPFSVASIQVDGGSEVHAP